MCRRIPKAPLALLISLALCLALAGCGDDSSERAKKAGGGTETPQAAQTPQTSQTSRASERPDAATAEGAGRSEGGPAAESAPDPDSGVRVYALRDPGEPASPEEAERARAAIDYANLADEVFATQCARYPLKVSAGVGTYRTEYRAPVTPGGPPPAGCLKEALPPPPGMEEEYGKMLDAMDGARETIRNSYAKLQAYAADDSIVDDGVLGDKLCKEIEEAFGSYLKTLQEFRTKVEEEAAKGQDVVLQGHPLRDHVLLAGGVVAQFRALADAISANEPSPASLDGPLLGIEEDIRTAENLPFPLPGAAEMHYRAFLKDARSLLGVFREGQAESFHERIRAKRNAVWEECRRSCSAFLEVLEETPPK